MIRQKPFEKRIRAQQKLLKKHFIRIYNSFYDLIGEEAPQVIVEFPKVFDRPEGEIKEEALNEYEKGTIPLEEYYRITRPDWSDEKIEEMVEATNKSLDERSERRVSELERAEEMRAEVSSRFEAERGRNGQVTEQ